MPIRLPSGNVAHYPNDAEFRRPAHAACVHVLVGSTTHSALLICTDAKRIFVTTVFCVILAACIVTIAFMFCHLGNNSLVRQAYCSLPRVL